MQVRILVSVAGDGFAYGPGVDDLPPARAQDLINAGYAEPIKGDKRNTKNGNETNSLGSLETRGED
jgi:hypothetical protein